MGTHQRFFVLVPDDSTLEWTLSSIGATFNASAEASTDGVIDKRWTHVELANRTVTLKPLKSPKRYILTMQVAFTGDEEIEVDLVVRVLRKDGTVHSVPWKVTMTGKRPEDATFEDIMVSVITRKVVA